MTLIKTFHVCTLHYYLSSMRVPETPLLARNEGGSFQVIWRKWSDNVSTSFGFSHMNKEEIVWPERRLGPVTCVRPTLSHMLDNKVWHTSHAFCSSNNSSSLQGEEVQNASMDVADASGKKKSSVRVSLAPFIVGLEEVKSCVNWYEDDRFLVIPCCHDPHEVCRSGNITLCMTIIKM